MKREELLLELRDISAPAEPAWWLLAPGHSVLAATIFGVLLLAWWWWRQQRNRRLLRLATVELDRIASRFDREGNTGQLALALARWLKQVALLAYPEERLEGVNGDEWLAFLDRSLGQDRFSRGEGRVFADDVYRREAHIDAAVLIGLCRSWLQATGPRLLRRGRG